MCSNRCNNNSSENNYVACSNLNGNGYYMNNYNYSNMNYGSAYVPNQVLNTTFSPIEGLANGTIFPELVRPYYPGQSMELINYLRYNNGGGCGR